ncbi:MAG: YCF48-related protein [Bacteroidota bacterium]
MKVNKTTFYYPYFFFLPLLSGFFLLGCSDSASRDFELIETNSNFDFHSIENYQNMLYATGGDVWEKSELAISEEGQKWTVDSLTNKSIFDLYTDGNTLYGVGNDGYIFSGQPELTLSRTKFWGMLRGFSSSREGFIAVGGKDFNKGWIYKVNSNLQIDTTHTFENEFLTVDCNNLGTCIAAGYGIIASSVDYGISWQRSSETGDYYNAISVNNNGDFFIVGYNGTIIHSDDNGITWNKIKNGHSPLTDNKPFRSIKFKGETGVIVGDNGLIWISENSGQDWIDASIQTDLDLFDFTFFQSKVICASEGGRIISVGI